MSEPRRTKKGKGAIKREMDPRRWAYLIFALGGFMAAWVLSHVIEEGWDMMWSAWPDRVPRASVFYSNVAGIGVAVIGTLVALRKEAWFRFSTEVVIEISQVTWPTRAETRAATVVVIVMTLICSGLLFGMDQVWSNVTDLLYGI
jgi:preprotein translocase subunit SecE